MSSLQPPLNDADFAVRGRTLEAYMHAHIPLVVQMQVRVSRYDAVGLSLEAPLAPNINHEQSAFGGSLASLCTLACWGYLWLGLDEEPRPHMVVSESKMSYLKPVTSTLSAHCAAPDAKEWRRFLDTLARRNRARLALAAEISQAGVVAARYAGEFVAYRGSVA